MCVIMTDVVSADHPQEEGGHQYLYMEGNMKYVLLFSE